VYKLAGNRRRPYIARVTIGWSPEGKQLYRTIGYFKTYKEGLNALAEYHKKPGLASGATLAQVHEKWKATQAYTKLAAKTQEGYDLAWNHLKAIGDMPIKDVRKSHIQDIIDGLVARGIGYATCHRVKVLAGILLKHAMDDDLVERNYATNVVLPEKPESDKETFNDLEIEKLTRLAEAGDVWAGTVLIFIYTGMRIGELVGLTKFNVDMREKFITGGIKTDAGKNRVVPISPKIERYVEYWYNQPGEYLIQIDGKPIRVDYYRRYLYYPALERAGVRKLNPHKARHTFGTLLDRAGVNTKHIQELMGHADYSTTANIYTHPDIAELRKAVAKL